MVRPMDLQVAHVDREGKEDEWEKGREGVVDRTTMLVASPDPASCFSIDIRLFTMMLLPGTEATASLDYGDDDDDRDKRND